MCPSCVTYAFNNVIYDTSNNFDPQGLITAGHQSNGDQGTFYLFNNTIEPGGSCMGTGEVGSSLGNVHYANNHCISSDSICLAGEVTCIDDGGNLLQSPAQANAAGYTDSETYAFSPTNAQSPTVQAGTNEQGYCTALKSLNANAYNACLHDIDYIGYDTTRHVVVHRRAPVARPQAGPWDVGAYEFTTATGSGGTAGGSGGGAGVLQPADPGIRAAPEVRQEAHRAAAEAGLQAAPEGAAARSDPTRPATPGAAVVTRPANTRWAPALSPCSPCSGG